MSSKSLFLSAALLLFAFATSGDSFAAPPDHAKGKPPPHAGTQGPPPHAGKKGSKKPLVIEEFGSLSAGAQVLKNPGQDGGEFHYDYLYSNFLIPQGARKNSLVLWHGCLGAAWERRPDGGTGFQSLLVQRGFSTFVLDSPRISRGARGLGAYSFNAVTSGGDCSWVTFRYGVWFPPEPRSFYPGVQLAQDPDSAAALCELSGSPGGPPGGGVAARNAVLALLDKKAGDTVLVTHSANGPSGFMVRTQDQNDKIKGIVTYEPVSFIWPEGEAPPPLNTAYDGMPQSPGAEVPLSEFMKLTTIPIQVVWGDNIPTEPETVLEGPERWRLRVIYSQQFVDLVNSYGGNAEVLKLPEIGVTGNTHFPFFDLNNDKIADLMVDFLKRTGLDKH